MKKKLLVGLLALSVSAGLFAGCSSKQAPETTPSAAENETQETEGEAPEDAQELETIKIGASPSPHAEILEVVKPIIKEAGYELEIIEYADYVQPNVALEEQSLFANYFQHQPYLDNFIEENDASLVSIATIHYEPYGIYSSKIQSLEELRDGAVVAVPNDTSNEARALLLLQAQGLIKIKDGVGIEATINDIVENPYNLDIKEIEAAQIPRSLQDVDIAIINGNYAIPAGLSVADDALAIEDTESISAQTYGNVLVVHGDNEDSEAAKALKDAFFSDEVKNFIQNTYEGAVVPMF